MCKNPCYQCEDRKVGCHSDCNKYIEWSTNHKKKLAEINKIKQEVNTYNSYKIDIVRKTKKRSKK